MAKKFRTVMDELDTNFDTSGETNLEKQYRNIVRWQPSEYLTHCAKQPIHRGKNRSASFIPSKAISKDVDMIRTKTCSQRSLDFPKE